MATPTTTAAPSTPCLLCPILIGYYYLNNSWNTLGCFSGSTFSTTEYTGIVYADCITTASTDIYIPSSCESTSLRIVTPGITYTCAPTKSACDAIVLYSNLDLDGIPTTMVACADTEFPLIPTLVRTTTYSSASAAPTTSSQTAPSTQSSSGLVSSSVLTGSDSTESLSTSTSTALASSSTDSTPNSNNSNNSKESNAIGLGTGIGLGLPAILIALAAWLFPRYRRTRRNVESAGEKETAGPPDPHPRIPDPNLGSEPEMTLYRTPIPPRSHGNPAEMEQTGLVPRSELGVDRWESNIGGIGCG